MNTEGFTGKAQAYAAGRPSYPDEAIDYICSLVSSNAIFADIGAGTGKFTQLVARNGYEIFAVEPNIDMLEQLKITLAPFPNAKVINSTAEATTIQNNSVDIIICSQSLGWLNLDTFRTECRRIGKSKVIIVSLFNEIPGNTPVVNSHCYTSKQASELFFNNPIIREFPNPTLYTRERWIQKNASLSDKPKPSESGYEDYISEINAIFDRDSVDGFLRQDLVTVVYSEMI